MQILCPHCGAALQTDSVSGQELLCPWCRNPFTVRLPGGEIIDVHAEEVQPASDVDVTEETEPLPPLETDSPGARDFPPRPRGFVFHMSRTYRDDSGCGCGLGCLIVFLLLFLLMRGCLSLFS